MRKRGNVRGAKDPYCSGGCRFSPHDVPILVNLGNLLRDRKRLKEAEEAYRTALSQNGIDVRIQYDLGLILAEIRPY